MTCYYKHTEPVLLGDDNKTLQYYDIHDNELLHLKVHLKSLLQVPCCRFSTIYIYTDNTLKHIQEKTINIFNDKMKNNLTPKQTNLFYVGEELGDVYDVSMFNIYNYSTITRDIIIIVNKNAVRIAIKMVDHKIR